MNMRTRYELATILKNREYNDDKDLPQTMVEVGLGFGDFSAYLLGTFCRLSLTSVESWRGRFMKTRMTDARDGVMERMQPYLDEYDYRVLEMDSGDAANHFGDCSLDCVYIDAGHDYRNVKADIGYWFPKVKLGGIFCGHDYKKVGVPGVRTAVNEFCKGYGYKVAVTEDVNPNPSWYITK